MKFTFKPLFVFAVLSVGSAPFAATFTLNASADARILSLFQGSNFGSDFLSTYNVTDNVQRTAIKFDLSALTGQTIVSANLRLFGSPFFSASGPATNSVWRIGEDWVENQTTWFFASSGTPWSTAGGQNFGSTGLLNSNPYSTTSYVQGGHMWVEHDVTSLVSEWVSGTYSNFGFMLSATPQSEMHYVSREGAYTTQQFAGNVPELVIETEVVPEPISLLTLTGIGLLIAKKRRGKK